MTPEEFAAKWEGKTDMGCEIVTPWVRCATSHHWITLVRNNHNAIYTMAVREDGRTDSPVLGSLIPRKVQRWVTRYELKEGDRIVDTSFGRHTGTVVTQPCIQWASGGLATANGYSGDARFLIEESA